MRYTQSLLTLQPTFTNRFLTFMDPRQKVLLNFFRGRRLRVIIILHYFKLLYFTLRYFTLFCFINNKLVRIFLDMVFRYIRICSIVITILDVRLVSFANAASSPILSRFFLTLFHYANKLFKHIECIFRAGRSFRVMLN